MERKRKVKTEKHAFSCRSSPFFASFKQNVDDWAFFLLFSFHTFVWETGRASVDSGAFSWFISSCVLVASPFPVLPTLFALSYNNDTRFYFLFIALLFRFSLIFAPLGCSPHQ